MRVGRCFHRCLPSGSLRKRKWHARIHRRSTTEPPGPPVEIEVPASTGLAIVLALASPYGPRASLQACRSAPLGVVLASQVASAGSGESPSARARRNRAYRPEEIYLTTERRIVNGFRFPHPAVTRVAPCPYVSDFFRRKRRSGGQHRHGVSCLCLRDTEGRKHWYPSICSLQLPTGESERLLPAHSIHFTPTLSPIAFLLHGLVSFLSACSTVQCSDVSASAILLGGLVAPARGRA